LISRLGDSQIVENFICKEDKGQQRDVCAVNERNLFVLKNTNLVESDEFDENICGKGTILVDGVCQAVKTDTVGSDAPFFGIFVYLDNLISWIFGK